MGTDFLPPATPEVGRQQVRELLKRHEVESDLLVKRTAAMLTLNGLMAAAVAAGDRLPPALKLLVAGVMIAINAAWLLRAASARGFMEALFDTAYRDEYDAMLPADARIHKDWTAHRRIHWFSTTYVFTIGVPFGLLVCWLCGIGTSALFPVPPANRFQFVPEHGEIRLLDTQTGDVWRKEPRTAEK